MSRFNYQKVSPQQQREYIDRLSDIVANLRTKKEAGFFLERLLTDGEVVMLVRRLQIAEMLVGGLTYEQIQRKLKVGKSTILNVDRWLTDAAYEYRLIREHQREVELSKKQAQKHREKRHRESTMPGTLKHLLRHDSRFIVLRLLLGDF